MYEFPHELPNDLRLKILGNEEIPGTFWNSLEIKPSASLLVTAITLWQ